MATLYTHAMVGLGAARLATSRPMPWAYWGLAALLPVVADFDVFSTAPYGSLWGHRGITHSLAFALAISTVAAGVSCRYLRVNGWLLAGLFFVVAASHDLLDAMTRGGADIPLFWPLDSCYGNWGPLPVSDIGFGLPDPRTSRAVRAELLWIWLPMGLLVGLVTTWRHVRKRRSAGNVPASSAPSAEYPARQ